VVAVAGNGVARGGSVFPWCSSSAKPSPSIKVLAAAPPPSLVADASSRARLRLLDTSRTVQNRANDFKTAIGRRVLGTIRRALIPERRPGVIADIPEPQAADVRQQDGHVVGCRRPKTGPPRPPTQAANDWLAVKQFTLKGSHHTRRPDGGSSSTACPWCLST